MILDQVTETIQVVLEGAVTTNQLEWITSWADHDPVGERFTPNGTHGLTNGVTAVDVITAPSANVQRQAKIITVFNSDTVAAVVRVQKFDGTNTRRWVRASLDPDWSLQWEPGGTWHVYDENGVLQQSGGAAGSGSVTSAQFQALSNKVSTLSQQGSVHSQAISVISQALSVLSVTVAAETSNRISADNALSNVISALDASLSARVTSVEAHVNTVSNTLSVLSDAHTSLVNRVSANSGAGGGGSVTSTEVSAVSAQAASALSQALSVLSVTDAALSARVDSVGNAVSVLSQGLSVISQQVSVMSTTLSNEISVRSNQNSIALQGISVLSQQVSVLSQALSVLSTRFTSAASDLSQLRSAVSGVSTQTAGASATGLQAVVDFLANRISLVAGGGGSVTSTEVSAVSAQAASALSQALSVLSVTDAALSARVDSVANALSVLSDRFTSGASDLSHIRSMVLGVSAASGAGTAVGLQSVVNALQNRISANSGGGGGGSVTSTELSAVSAQAASAISNAQSIGSATAAALSARIDSVNALSGNAQFGFRSNVTSVRSGNTLSLIDGLSISLAASGTYAIEGVVMWECGTSGGFAFGVSLPALGAGGTWIRMQAPSIAPGQNQTIGAMVPGYAAMSAVAALTTAIVSVSVTAVNALRYLRIEGLINTSASGALGIMVKSSVAGASMSVRSGYIRAIRLG